MTATKNYGWDADGPFGTIYETDAPADNAEVFATFTEARTALVRWMTGMAAEWQKAARNARALRKADIDRLDRFDRSVDA
jgi:hypothetical protein